MRNAILVSGVFALLLGGCLGASKSGSAGPTATDTFGDGAGGTLVDTFVDDGPPFEPRDVGPETLVTHALFVDVLCTGGVLRVDYTSSLTVGADNLFSVQVSDASGSFDSFTNIGSVRSGTSGTIYATIPEEFPAGDHYRVRVIASSPYTLGTDNGSDLGVAAAPRLEPADLTASPRYVTVGEHVLWSSPSFGDATYRWNLGASATPATSTMHSPRVTYGATGTPVATLTVTTAAGCSATATSDPEQERGVTVIGCSFAIPSDATVVTGYYEATRDDDALWVCPGGSVVLSPGRTQRIFVSTGGSASLTDGSQTWLYAQTGSSVTLGDGRGVVVVQGDGASVTGVDPFTTVVACPSVVFDLSDAPSPGCD